MDDGYEYLIRFALGGAALCSPDLSAPRLALRSVGSLGTAGNFYASATLIERHEIRRKRDAGGRGECRGRKAAALGSVAMVAFAVVFLSVSPYGAVAAFLCSAIGWIPTAVSLWYAIWGLK
ncbi:hypothetical protein GGQ85_004406 [Nitrobacter vulgaris]|uniref:hypothetical protein n=1 Tax=Nitrobacter vulgaris TaxID=29421 RepID=UPI002859F09A|nr:hypothetical protein [Nitrobacter vulgaris]MDR6306672.1 hypothetical protein [Nitrobacter vulgaris]